MRRKTWALAKRYWPILGILLFQLAAFHRWFFTGSLFTQGDWGFYVKEALVSVRLNYFSVWLPDNDFGRVLIDVGQAPTYALYGLLAKVFGLDFAGGERVVHFIPILFVTNVGSYFLLRLFLKSNLSVFCGMLVYTFNTYSLTLMTGHLTLAAGFAFLPLTLYFFVKALREQKIGANLNYAILTALSLTICSAYEPRSALIAVGVLFVYLLYHVFFERSVVNSSGDYSYAVRRILLYLLVGIIFVLLNFYWMYGLQKTPLDNDSTILDRGLFGSAYFTLLHAVSLHQPYWNNMKPVPFVVQPIPFYFWIFPLAALFGLRRIRENQRILFFALITVLGILLSKQSDAPFTGLYQWLFTHVPGFNAYREASKFYSLIVLGYAGLIGFSVEEAMLYAQRDKDKRYLIALPIAIAVVAVMNCSPFILNKK